MDILQLGAQLMGQKLGGTANHNPDAIADVLQKLVGNGNTLDVAGMVSAMQSGGLASIAASWLGDGGNDAISTTQVRDLVGGDRLTEAAAQLGTDEGSLLTGLAEALPQMVDRSSSGGSLLDAVGGLGGALDMAKKLF